MAEHILFCFLIFVYQLYVCQSSVAIHSNVKYSDVIKSRTVNRYRQTFVIEADDHLSHDNAVHGRHKRQTAESRQYAQVHELNDTHFQLLVHWAGQGSDAIIALGRNKSRYFLDHRLSNSTVWISRDYGSTFQAKSLKINSTTDAIIEEFFISPISNTHYIFADVVHRYLFTTTNTGTFIYKHHLPFKPKVISFHPVNRNWLLGYNEDDPHKRLWKSLDFGQSWEVFQTDVIKYHWGLKEYGDDADTVYLHRKTGYQSVVVKSNYRLSAENGNFLLTSVERFKFQDNYMFATRQMQHRLELWVSYKRQPFKKAIFPNKLNHTDYFIVDASEDQVFLCVNHNGSTSALYTSGQEGVEYSLSLSNVVYFNPKGVNNDTWLRYFTEKPFVDVHKVDGLRGIYIASTMANTTLDLDNQISMITYNKGAEWKRLTAPANDSLGHSTHCSRHWYWHYYNAHSCSLHLTQKLSQYSPLYRSTPILTKKSAPGLIMGVGKLNRTLGRGGYNFNTYVSRDGGIEWQETLKGSHYYVFGDHGGLIVAVPQYNLTGEFLYSWDEGQTWTLYKFSDYKMYVYGALTEPGEETTIFFLFGSKPGVHRWITIKIDLKPLFGGKQCQTEDYKQWSPTDNPRVDCLLGRKMVFERRRSNSLCLNTRNYDRPISVQNCTCKREDFECDFGYKRKYYYSSECVPDGNVTTHDLPHPCPEGSTYTRTKGYRRISGDTCTGGADSRYAPDVLECPSVYKEDFMIYSTRTSIHKYLFAQGRDEVFHTGHIGDVVAIDYDYANNCLFWADNTADVIKRVCMSADQSMDRVRVMVREHLSSVEGMAYDWMSGNLIWVDAGHPSKIEMSRSDGSHRRTLVNQTHLTKPRSLALAPDQGLMFWTDWDSTHPRIMSAWMDGSNVKTLVTSSYYVHWPNGITVDSHTNHIYWVDAYLKKLVSCDFKGHNRKSVIHRHSLMLTPYSVSVYKDDVYWTDSTKQAIMVASKYNGLQPHVFKGNISGITDLKILHVASQQGSSVCSTKSGNCEVLCTERPGNDSHSMRTCLCSDEHTITRTPHSNDERCGCQTGEKLNSDGFCVLKVNQTSCAPHQFECVNSSRCVPKTWSCDGDFDCVDGSDERGCPMYKCSSNQFQCDNFHCISLSWKCDHEDDCGDGSDEPKDCKFPNCSSNQFECDNARCVPWRWLCDGDDDCHDGSDETPAACKQSNHTTVTHALTTAPTVSSTCRPNQFTCTSGWIQCISNTWKCDGMNDCLDGSDERGCSTNSTCSHNTRPCVNGQCVYKSRWCDGMRDCPGGEDEVGCNYTTVTVPSTVTPTPDYYNCSWYTFKFRCLSGQCISLFEVCDGHKDCPDNSDEQQCGYSTTRRPTTTMSGGRQCRSDQYHCAGGDLCIPMSWVCDGYKDCLPQGDDENDCNGTKTCPKDRFQCFTSRGCILTSWVCDNKTDCLDGSDELYCANKTGKSNTTVTPPSHCSQYDFSCGDGTCVAGYKRCDGHVDCRTGLDEAGCNHTKILFRVNSFYLLPTNDASKITIAWSGITPTYTGNMYRDLKVRGMVRYNDGQSTHWIHKDVHIGQNLIEFGSRGVGFDYTVLVVVNGIVMNITDVRTATPTVSGAPQNVKATAVKSGGSWTVTVTWTMLIANNVQRYQVYFDTGDSRTTLTVFQKDIQNNNYKVVLPNAIANKTYQIHVVTFKTGGILGATSKTVNVTVGKGQGCHVTLTIDQKLKAVKYSVQGPGKGEVHNIQLRMTSQQVLYNKLTTQPENNLQYHDGIFTGTITVADFAPGVTYEVMLHVQGSEGSYLQCEGAETSFVSQGSPVPRPSVSATLLGERNIKLSWSVNKVSAGATYRVYYTPHADAMKIFLEEPDKSGNISKTEVKGTNGLFSSLLACEMYYFTVQQVKPVLGLPSKLFSYPTNYDKTAPPKNVRVELQSLNSKTELGQLAVTFDSSCTQDKVAKTYIIYVKDVLKNKMNGIYKNNVYKTTNIRHVIDNVDRGALYTVYVESLHSEPSESVNFTVKPYKAPTQFKVFRLKDVEENDFGLVWEAPLENITQKVGYEIYHSEDRLVMDQKTKKATLPGNATFTPLGNTDRKFYTATKMDPRRDHSFKVRIESINDYPGMFTEPETVFALPLDELKLLYGDHINPDDHSSSSSGSSEKLLVGIIVPCAVVILLLVVVLSLYMVRHRRLQNSFLSFANSHYDTRSERTTFGSSNDITEEEEEPMIRGFSDDEPLVMA